MWIFFPLRALIDFDFINSSVKCSVNGLADQSHASLPFNSQILLTAWSGGLPFIPPPHPPRLWGQCLLSVQYIPLGFCIRIAIWIKPLSKECVPGWKWRYGGLVRCEGATPWHMVAVAGHRRVGNSLKAAATWRPWIWMIRWSSENKRPTPSAPVTTPHPETLTTEFSKPLSRLGLVSRALIRLTNAALYGLWRDVQFSRCSPRSSLPCWPVLTEIKANCNWKKHAAPEHSMPSSG